MKRRYSSGTGSTTVVVGSNEGQTSSDSDSGHFLRLSKRVKPAVLSGARKLSKELSECRTSNDVLNTLLAFIKQLPLESADETEFAAKVIVERASKEEDGANRVQMFTVLAQLLRYPGVNLKYTVEEIIRCLNKEESHKVVAEILKTLGVIGKFLPSEVDLHSRILDLAKEYLQRPNQLVRSRCLHIIAMLGEDTQHLTSDTKFAHTLATLQQFTLDQDPRVRTCALESLLILHERGLKLSPSVYDSACRALDDDYEGVRLKAVKLVWVLSQIYPERMVSSSSSEEERRCVDDAFVKICQMVTDLSMKVRVEASGLLGSLHLVSHRFLDQTLDKKVMSHLHRRKTEHEQQRELHAAGLKGSEKWSKKVNVSMQRGEMNPEEVSLIDSGACGAFVYGLEDELLEVRSAAVDSLCELADQHPRFARLSLDFLVDMFNDEIESVRLNAIHSLRKVSRHVVLREDQLETVLGVLEDYSGEIRNAVRELLSHCQLSTRACLHAAIYALLGNLTKYPQDKELIWSCLKQLGSQHENLAASLVPELLSTHPFFATSEPNVDDAAYVGMVVIVLNAALKSPVISSNLPSHTRRHYAYLRDRYPHLIPEITLDKNLTCNVKEDCQKDLEKPETFLWKTLQKARQALSFPEKTLQKANIKKVVEDLRHLATIKSRLSSTANCALLYLTSQLNILMVQTDQFWNTPPVLCSNSGCLSRNVVEDLIVSSYKINTLFVGLDCEQREMIREIRLMAHSLLVIYMHRRNLKALQNNTVGVRIWEQLLARIRCHVKFHRSGERDTESLVETFASFQNFVECNITKPSVIMDYLTSLVTRYQLPDLCLENQLRQAEAVMTRPQGGSDNPLRFTTGLTLGVDVAADITNITDTSNVYVQVVFPDFTRQLFKPKSSDFRVLSNMKYKLVTKVVLSHSTWSDPCYVDVSLVVKYTQDVDEQAVLDSAVSIVQSSSNIGEKKVVKQRKNGADNLQDDPCYVDVSLVVKYTQDVDEQAVLDSAVSIAQSSSNIGEKKVVKQRKNGADNLQDGYVGLCSPVQIYVLPKSGPC